ncbi:hypothetical protein [Aliikangiella maris]|uniref:Uncharacterized protein n=2 Tax=Aliikangiella maris TaxID=3162458 RepID=A0ABV3MR42_9GAMM
MNGKLLILIIGIFLFPLPSQSAEKISTFHRLLIFNSKSELMVVKIKDTDFWITPSWYQDNTQLINEGMQHLAAEYGLTISQPVLREIFTVKNQHDNSLSLRHFFSVNSDGKLVKKPEIIEEVRWLAVKDAVKLITFPYINILINQVVDHPDIVWGGSILRFKEGDEHKIKIIESLYPLFQ